MHQVGRAIFGPSLRVIRRRVEFAFSTKNWIMSFTCPGNQKVTSALYTNRLMLCFDFLDHNLAFFRFPNSIFHKRLFLLINQHNRDARARTACFWPCASGKPFCFFVLRSPFVCLLFSTCTAFPPLIAHTLAPRCLRVQRPVRMTPSALHPSAALPPPPLLPTWRTTTSQTSD